MASVHDKLERVRKPRVHIRYDVQTEGGIVERELPFVVGVMGDYAGDSKLEPLAKRRFTEISRDNFNAVMGSIAPSLNIRLEDTLAGNGDEVGVQLKFKSIEDFEPGRVVEQVPELKRLKDTRDKLRDLLTQVDRSPELENLLEEVLKNSDNLDALAKAVGTAPKTEG